MRNIKLIIEYDGTNYCGWQKQKDMSTIQGTIQETLQLICNEDIELIGSSRTDSGVHAEGFVANFKTNSKIPSEKFRDALNVKLPDDIAILKSSEVEQDFHSRYNAKGKTYEYTILNRDFPSALSFNYAYHFKKELNFDYMNEACKNFIGKHDFFAFKTQGSSVKGSIRTIYDINMIKDGDYIKINVTGDGFLYNMVRIIVGTLINVGLSKNKPQDIIEIIDKKDRNLAGACVPSKGLVLKKVYY